MRLTEIVSKNCQTFYQTFCQTSSRALTAIAHPKRRRYHRRGKNVPRSPVRKLFSEIFCTSMPGKTGRHLAGKMTVGVKHCR